MSQSEYTTAEETTAVIRKATLHELWLEKELDEINPCRNEMGHDGELAALHILIYKLKQKATNLKGECLVMVRVMKRALTVIETIAPEDSEEEKELTGVKNFLTSIIQNEGSYL